MKAPCVCSIYQNWSATYKTQPTGQVSKEQINWKGLLYISQFFYRAIIFNPDWPFTGKSELGVPLYILLV